MLNIRKTVITCLAAVSLVYCGSSEVREDLPIQIPDDIDSSNAGKNVAEAQKELEQLKSQKLNEVAATEMLKAEEFVNTARKHLSEEEEIPAYFAAGKAKAYMRLAKDIKVMKTMDKRAEDAKKELK